MNPERVQIGPHELWCGDCREVLPTLWRFDAVITDPPYEAAAHSHGRRLLGKQTNGLRTVEMGGLDFEAITEELRRAAAAQMARVCDGWILTFCQAEAVTLWRDALEDGGARYMRAMVWIKPDGVPQFTGDRPGMGYESIVSAWSGLGRSRWNGGGRHGVFTHAQRDDNNPKQHMTQKPIRLMCDLVSLFTDLGESVLDPFMGSGTTGVACVQLGRKFTGIERERKYFDIACQRIERAMAQAQLFPPEEVRAAEQTTIFQEAA